MKVLVACEFSGIVRDAFRAKGHDAWSCDLLETESNSSFHFQCNVLTLLEQKWDLLIAHPPCTYLCNSGVRWLSDNSVRWQQMLEACNFFNKLLNAPINKICIENPIMHKHAKRIVACNYSQIIQPWQFGHPETKSTCLWLVNLPMLKSTNEVEGIYRRVHHMSPSKDRWKERSRTYIGIANAMAEQWS